MPELNIKVDYIAGKPNTPPQLTLTKTKSDTRQVDKVVIKPSRNWVHANTLDVFSYADVNRGSNETVKHKPDYQQIGKQQFSLDGISKSGLDVVLNGDINVEIKNLQTGEEGRISITEGVEGKQSVALLESTTPKLLVTLGAGDDRFYFENTSKHVVPYGMEGDKFDYQINMGSGNDQVFIGAINAPSSKYIKPVIDGGTGDDYLSFISGTLNPAREAAQLILKNFETINLNPNHSSFFF